MLSASAVSTSVKKLFPKGIAQQPEHQHRGVGCLRSGKSLTRLCHRDDAKVNTPWNLYTVVHNIEKLAKTQLWRGRKRWRCRKAEKPSSGPAMGAIPAKFGLKNSTLILRSPRA